MAIGDPIEIQRLNEDNEPQTYMKTHALKINKTRSSEFFEVGGEQAYAYITFTVRWNKLLAPIEFDTPDYRLIWHGQMFDIVGYDDYMEQHREVSLHCRSIRSAYGG